MSREVIWRGEGRSEVREGRKEEELGLRLNSQTRIDGPTWRFEAQRTANWAKGARETEGERETGKSREE
jgi:hypothetical protein